MKPSEIVAMFDSDMALTYDTRMKAMGAVKAMLHLVIDMCFAPLPDSAHILCAGSGTGTEIIYLAQRRPNWRFTAVEPAAAMMAQCRKAVAEHGIADRVDCIDGYVEDLPDHPIYDGATCLLVSHFFVERAAREAFLAAIGGRMRAGAPLLLADLSTSLTGQPREEMLTLWLSALRETGMEVDTQTYETLVNLSGTDAVSAMLAASGFEQTAEVFQAMMIRGWRTIRAAQN